MLDVSAAVSWFFADERDDLALAMAAEVLAKGAWVPTLFRWEVQNALLTAVRRDRRSSDQIRKDFENLDRLRLRVDDEIHARPLEIGLALAERFGLTAYDAAYLDLALRRSLPLMTRDRALRNAAAELRLLWEPHAETAVK
ncbi:MAG TPA: type II toxin-antitoxin system VapC family toxin [Candidatus Dormibacteraeota bacterium]|nr:type II toxin-antitoxin system VapC family toxin [Candidatus Dormibacteraeota bacterium]